MKKICHIGFVVFTPRIEENLEKSRDFVNKIPILLLMS